MTYEIYRYIFIGAAILSVIMLATTMVLFIVLKIPRVIGDLSGSTARKAIQNIRAQNERTGDKAYKVSPVNLERGKLTDKISPSGQVVPRYGSSIGMGMGTEKISTEFLMPVGEETTVLSEEVVGETTVLEETDSNTSEFEIEYEITFIHTDEMIGEGINLC